jgi:glycosyltransferase involved in cell wall biosynthesis
MGSLRILHVAPYFERAWAYGGIPRVVSAQVHALAAAGHRVTVMTTDACDADSRAGAPGSNGSSPFAMRVEHTPDGVEVRTFSNLSNALAYRWQLFTPAGFGRDIRASAGRFDVAHLHACHNVLTSTAARHLERAGIPYVVQPNGTAARIERRRAAKWMFDLLLGRHVLPDAALVIAVTEWEKSQLEGAGVLASRLRVVPNPVARVPSAPRPPDASFRERYDLTDGPLVLFLGMMSPRKHPEMLAKAVAGLHRTDVQLVLAGNDMGAGQRTMRVVREGGLEPRARFTGLLSGSARYAALAAADVVVYPSRDEAFGLVPLEALQVGTPVIVCNDAGCGEVVAAVGGGLLVPPGNAGALAAALDTMLRAPERWREAAARAGAEVRRRFHPDVVCAQLDVVYREAIAGGRRL